MERFIPRPKMTPEQLAAARRESLEQDAFENREGTQSGEPESTDWKKPKEVEFDPRELERPKPTQEKEGRVIPFDNADIDKLLEDFEKKITVDKDGKPTVDMSKDTSAQKQGKERILTPEELGGSENEEPLELQQ